MSEALACDPTDRFHVLLKEVVEEVKNKNAASVSVSAPSTPPKTVSGPTTENIRIRVKNLRSKDDADDGGAERMCEKGLSCPQPEELRIKVIAADDREAQESGVNIITLIWRRPSALESTRPKTMCSMRHILSPERKASVSMVPLRDHDGNSWNLNTTTTTTNTVQPFFSRHSPLPLVPGFPVRAAGSQPTYIAGNANIDTNIRFVEPRRFTERDSLHHHHRHHRHQEQQPSVCAPIEALTARILREATRSPTLASSTRSGTMEEKRKATRK